VFNFDCQLSDDRDYKTVLYREECVGPHFTVWIIVFYTFHSLLLIFGLFLAFETRKVSIPALNDSRFIGISVYNVVLLCAVGVPVSFFTNTHPTVSFSLICAVILFCTTLTLGILFFPKVRTLLFIYAKTKIALNSVRKFVFFSVDSHQSRTNIRATIYSIVYPSPRHVDAYYRHNKYIFVRSGHY